MCEPRLSRRQMLGIGGGAVASLLTASAGQPAAESQSKRGGVLTVRAWDPPNFDLQMLEKLAGACDVSRRRDLVHHIQRHAAVQRYYVHLPSGIHVAAWDTAVKNYAPNMSYDYGGRLAAAWLDR